MKLSLRRWFFVAVGILAFGFLLIQLIPFGRDHTNPPTVREPAWDSPRTEEMVKAACYDCHSNQTKWPWYSYVAPMSWLLYQDVTQARSTFNFDEITPAQGADWVGTMVFKIKDASMPPARYQALHPEARFSADERQELIDGLLLTFPQ